MTFTANTWPETKFSCEQIENDWKKPCARGKGIQGVRWQGELWQKLSDTHEESGAPTQNESKDKRDQFGARRPTHCHVEQLGRPAQVPVYVMFPSCCFSVPRLWPSEVGVLLNNFNIKHLCCDLMQCSSIALCVASPKLNACLVEVIMGAFASGVDTKSYTLMAILSDRFLLSSPPKMKWELWRPARDWIC